MKVLGSHLYKKKLNSLISPFKLMKITALEAQIADRSQEGIEALHCASLSWSDLPFIIYLLESALMLVVKSYFHGAPCTSGKI